MKDKEIHGNINGISDVMLKSMQDMYDIEMTRTEFIRPELVEHLAEFTSAINREISVLIARNGRIQHISVGDFDRVALPNISQSRSKTRLSGIRCVHTHPNTSGALSSVDYATLSDSRFDAMAAIGVQDGRATNMYTAYLTEQAGEFDTIGPIDARHADNPQLMETVFAADEVVGREETIQLHKEQEHAILIGLKQEGMDELHELATTAGAKVVASEVQHRTVPDSAYYLGRGKVNDLTLMVIDMDADLVIINADITPIQQRNLEERLGVKVVDRTTLILDIFAMRAQSREGRLQVELAQLKYLLPRLVGKGIEMSRQAASGTGLGIASRGPGETKLEVDRRRIRRRIYTLEKEIEHVSKQREMRRNRRLESGIPIVALVGYTNAGKSTLLNALSGATAHAEDRLFATLDPLTRRTTIKDREVIVTDTVGFVQDLPHDLVEAFHSTLEEVTYADVLIHVVDGSNPEMLMHVDVVEEVLGSLDAANTPTIKVFNKADLVQAAAPEDMIAISAKTGQGLEELKDAIIYEASDHWQHATLSVPYARSDIAAAIRAHGKILEEEYNPEEVVFEVEMPTVELKKVKHEIAKDRTTQKV